LPCLSTQKEEVFLWEHTARRQPPVNPEKSQNGTYLAGTLILDLPASRNVRNTFLLLKPPVYGTSYAVPKTLPISNITYKRGSTVENVAPLMAY